MKDALEAQRRPRRERPRIWFVLFMVLLAALMAGLGVWQLARLEQKQAILARIAERLDAPAEPLPLTADWPETDPLDWDYRPVALTGHFEHDQTVLVFTSLSDPHGEFSGPGYWVVAPFVRTEGGTVLVNRGFVPEQMRSIFSDGGPAAGGEITLTGIARVSEQANAFTPGPDTEQRIEWVRNVERLADMMADDLAPIAPVYVDQSAGEAGALPQGGETRLTLPNRHLEYAFTWFGLSAVTLVLLGFWLFRRRGE